MLENLPPSVEAEGKLRTVATADEILPEDYPGESLKRPLIREDLNVIQISVPGG